MCFLLRILLSRGPVHDCPASSVCLSSVCPEPAVITRAKTIESPKFACMLPMSRVSCILIFDQRVKGQGHKVNGINRA